MKILIVGLGSIGQRHARNLRAIAGDGLDLLAYRVRGRRALVGDTLDGPQPDDRTPEQRYGIRSFANLDDALAEEPRAVIVANPTAGHLAIARRAVNAGCDVFVEKPLAAEWAGVPALIEEVDRRGLVAMTGYPYRFHPALQRFRQLLDDGAVGSVVAARIEFGEYLPDWHPWEDYRESYAARRDLGGGVLLTQIHDLDYACWLWGLPARVYATGGRLSSLEIDVEDVASLLLEYPRPGGTFPVHVQLDYVQRPPVRRSEVIGEKGRLTLDLTTGGISHGRNDGTIVQELHAADRNDMFMSEMRHFLDCVERRAEPAVTLRAAAASLAVALAARESLASRRAVVPASIAPLARVP
jgi:predicted dehydrogenase